MFTEMGVGVRPWSIQLRKVMQACSQMYSSSRMMKPFFSNKGMKRSGGISPSVGCIQRTSPSEPMMREVGMCTLG